MKLSCNLFLLRKLTVSTRLWYTEAATRGVWCKKMFVEIWQNSQENTCARASFLIKLQAYNFIKKETLTQVFSCEFCKIFKNTYFTEHLWTTASKVFSLSKNINTLILFIVSWKNQFAQDISMLILAVLPSLVCLIGLPKCDLHKYVKSFKARS